MKSPTSPKLSCRHCRYYTPEGRRGGHCQQLNVAVQSAWKACTLAVPPFAPAWENLEGIIAWQQTTLAAMQQHVATACSFTEDAPESPLPLTSFSDRPSATTVQWM